MMVTAALRADPVLLQAVFPPGCYSHGETTFQRAFNFTVGKVTPAVQSTDVLLVFSTSC